MHARISLEGEVWEIEDISIENLLGIVEKVGKVGKLIPGSNDGGNSV
ncbi:hypothetical protein BH18ACT10_BH18ACT10_05010 [soil metagenome]